jgi:hypothetical protein
MRARDNWIAQAKRNRPEELKNLILVNPFDMLSAAVLSTLRCLSVG